MGGLAKIRQNNHIIARGFNPGNNEDQVYIGFSQTMDMPYIKAWLHLVWATKNRAPFLKKEIRPTVFDHIKANARSKNIFLDCVNGYDDHIHCLVSLSPDNTISKVVQLIKGESSCWINKQKLSKEKFEWQEEYFALSVSYSQLGKIREYIYSQEDHHRQKTFQQEYDEFMRKYEFEK